MENSDFRTRITSLCRWIDPTCGFCMKNSDFWTRITSVCGSQTSPVIFCMYNSVPSIRNTSLHGSQPSSVVFACKTAHFGPEFQVSLGPSPHLRFLHTKQRVLSQNYKSLWVPDLTYPFVQSKRPDLHQNIKSILVPAHFSDFCMQNSVISIRITSLHGSQPSRVVFGCKTASFGPE